MRKLLLKWRAFSAAKPWGRLVILFIFMSVAFQNCSSPYDIETESDKDSSITPSLDFLAGSSSFGNQKGLSLTSEALSDIVQVTNVTEGSIVKISGQGQPQYRICDDSECLTVAAPWTEVATGIKDGQYIQLRLTTSSTHNTTTSVTVTIASPVDSGTDTWHVTTGLGTEACPEGFVAVPANFNYGINEFCVMKYEARNNGTDQPISEPSQNPWVYITRDDAISACQSLGEGFDLISNDEWQVLARSIEQQSANWSSGTVGEGCLFQGNNGDSDDCGFTGPESNPDSPRDPKAKLIVSNSGDEIWDLAGNAWEWVKTPSYTNFGLRRWVSILENSAGKPKDKFGPKGDYSHLNSGDYGGLGYVFLDDNDGTIRRGGSDGDGPETGIFAATQHNPVTHSGSYISFRCVYHHP